MNRHAFLLVALALLAVLPFSAIAASAQAQDQAALQRVIVQLNLPAAPDALQGPQLQSEWRSRLDQSASTLLASSTGQNLRLVRRFQEIPYLVIEATALELAELSQHPLVAGLAEDRLLAPQLEHSVPHIQANQAWSRSNGSGWAVAVLDTGVQASHPFLSGRISSEACFSTTSSSQQYSSQSMCPGGQSRGFGTGVAAPCSLGSCEHGTHVAGIIAGQNATMSGVAPGAQIIAVQVFSQISSQLYCGSSAPCALSFTSDQIAALEWLYQQREQLDLAAINISLGGGRFTDTTSCDLALSAMKAQIDLLRSAGIATLIAAGNAGYTDALMAPACISSAISVGSTIAPGSGVPDAISGFSNSASFLTLLAPGESINSALSDGSYGERRGTSMAAPHVAGAWALLRAARPDASFDEMLAALRNSGVPILDPRNGISTPRINVDAAVRLLAPLRLSQLSLQFGEQIVGSSSTTQRITLQNAGQNPLSISAIELSSGYVRGGGSCGKQLAAAASCTIDIGFAPTQPGVLNGTLTIRSTAPGPALTAQLTGIGIVAGMNLLASDLSFGNQHLGTRSAAQTVTLLNAGNQPISLQAIQLTGDYLHQGGSCEAGNTLAAGQRCTIEVSFRPRLSGQRSGTLRVQSDQPITPPGTVLSGNGIGGLVYLPHLQQ